jgi:hypothetical protein
MSEVVHLTILGKNEVESRVDNLNEYLPLLNSTASFGGLPKRTLLESGNIPIEELAELALREVQRPNPFYQVHRWFARRLSSQFRGMLAAISLDEKDASRFWDRFFGAIPLNESATVTVLPASTEISSGTTVTLVTGTLHPGSPRVPGRFLSSLTLSQEQRVLTTGAGHQQAQAAHGSITLYNAQPAMQTVPAGTLLVGADGVQVVTEQDVVIPAAQMPTEGQASVPTHALEAGPAGNIRAYDITGACCCADVFAQNTAAFHGGQNARTFPMVTAQNITGAVIALKASLTASAQAALQTQVQRGETLITPVPCTPMVTAGSCCGR